MTSEWARLSLDEHFVGKWTWGTLVIHLSNNTGIEIKKSAHHKAHNVPQGLAVLQDHELVLK